MKIIDGHDVIEHAEVNGEDRAFIRKLTDYIEDADEVETLYCCDRKRCENCNSDCFLTRDKSHADKPTSVIIIDGIEMVPSVVEPKPGEWIPCSERLPTLNEDGVSDMVLLCWSDGQRTVGAYQGNRTFVGQAWPVARDCRVTVIAWQSLPEPWEGADDE